MGQPTRLHIYSYLTTYIPLVNRTFDSILPSFSLKSDDGCQIQLHASTAQDVPEL
jgi:hypothetical protein